MKNLGNKAQNLIWLKEEIGSVPDFIIIKVEDYVENFSDLNIEIEKNISDPETLSSIIRKEAIFKEDVVHDSLKKIKAKLGHKIILRSSGTIEDSGKVSCAGLYESKVIRNLNLNDFKDSLLYIWENFYSERVSNYLKAHNIKFTVDDFSIICQRYIEPTLSGVVFLYPKERKAIINYSEGSAKKIVDGENTNSIEIDLSNDNYRNHLNTELNSKSFKKMLGKFKLISNLKNKPQDIEWSLNNKEIALLQIRDVTSDIRDTTHCLWDNTNIAESYPGITLPLTFSFIKNAYKNVYSNFFSFIGVSSKRIRGNEFVFENLLGHIRGRVYYNISNWYEMISLLPGYRFNKNFFEKMLNPQNKSLDKKRKNKIKILLSLPLFTLFIIKILATPIYSILFIKKFKRIYENNSKVNINKLNRIELIYQYKEIEKTFFSEWHIPILNDFRVMIFYGIFKSIVDDVTTKSDRQAEYLSLLISKSSLMSIEPLILLDEISQKIKKDEKIFKIINNRDIVDKTILNMMKENKEIDKMIEKYILKFGDRNASELKMETPSIKNEPEKIVGILRLYISSDLKELNSKKTNFVSVQKKLKREVIKKYKYKGYLINLFIKPLIYYASNSISLREEMRLYRSVAYGVARDIFIEIGERLEKENYLNNKKDIFYLTREEIFDWILNQNNEHNIKGTIKERIELYNRFNEEKPLSRRIKTFGIPPNMEIIPVLKDGNEDVEILSGIAGSKGIIIGEIVKMSKFDPTIDIKGKILVVEQTDPGWIIIFPHIAGLITERGNILSHAAIVTRELGIPSVVAVENALTELEDGQIVELNGWEGKISIIQND